MEIEDSLPWPSNIPQLKRLDELLRCGICYELMSTSMITACSHNYCSLCIRQYLSYKTQCPACFQETTTQHLRNNRLIDEIIGLFSTLRDKVARMSQASKGGVITSYLETSKCEGEAKADEAVISSFPSSQPFITTTTTSGETSSMGREGKIASPKGFLSTQRSDRGNNVSHKINLGKNMLPNQSSSPLKSNNNNYTTPSKSSSSSSSEVTLKSPLGSLQASRMSTSQSPSTRGACQVASGHFSIFNHSTSNEGNGEDGGRVPCPVCSVAVPERNINLHLDACLQRMEKGEDIEIIMETSKRKLLPKLVYSLLSEKQMRQKLKEIGLSFQGDKTALVNRHRRYVTLYNAECDVAEPRPIPELLRQVEREEREKARVASSQSIFTYDRKTAPEIIEKEQKNYMKKNKDHFAQLIDDVRRRREEQRREDLKVRAAEKQKDTCEQMLGGNWTDSNLTNPSTSSGDTLLGKYTQSDSRVMKSSEILKLNESKDENISVLSKKKKHLVCNNSVNPGKNSDKQGKKEIFYPVDPETANSVDTCAVQKKSKAKCEVRLVDEHSFKPRQENCFGNHTDDAALLDSDDPLPNNILPSEKRVESSPDFFLASPSSSEGSGESVSLLQDSELVLQDTESLLQDSEPLLQDTEPLLQDTEPLLQDSEPLHLAVPTVRLNEKEYDEELIPAHQPETSHVSDVEDREAEFQVLPLSPEVGRRSTRARMTAPHPDHTIHDDDNFDTQPLISSSQGDPEYIPSKLSQALDSEELDFEIPQQTRRSNRKRKTKQEVMSSQKGRKKKK
nr:E3 ubiquitin-protein ligase RAD18-like isoform X1 [Procambarus clarkii]XP_045623933.1 E3 ubiquitin-protein ligase RAD18-like isoform X1 [Procambarus clarkii]XP_045623934.1 E3 ubiquitin-protein ligase RAD18-like isoform X1 [Procambarus clarkii]